ncbi:MAG: BatD family protein [Phycisphaerae bacterium]
MRSGWLSAALGLMAAARCAAADVSAELSSPTAQVGEEVVLAIRVADANDVDAPQLPAAATMRLTLDPGVSTQTSMEFNGRRTIRSTIRVYTIRIVPLQTGRLTIPGIRIRADGKTYSTDPLLLVVSRGEAGTPLIVEVHTDRESAYVEEPVRATLRVWIRVFRHQNTTLSPGNMWSLVDRNASALGAFGEPQFVEQRVREDGDGRAAAYYVYEQTAIIYPEAPGPLRLSSVSLTINYPLSLARDFFGELRMQRSRRLSASPAASALTVKPIPDEGRPENFSGAVGQFQMSASASPTTVSVGDPITLRIVIRGTGRLERLAAPSLAGVAELARDFKVPDESLAGTVSGDEKTFTQTVRAARSEVTEIPAIPFCYFDPQRGRFEVVHSEAIPITVRTGANLSMSQVVEAEPNRPRAAAALVSRSEGLLANCADARVALADQRFAPGAGWAACLAGCPALYAAAWLVARRRRKMTSDVAYRRRSQAAGAARRQLLSAGESGAAAAVVAAVGGFVADCVNAPPGAMTRAEIGRVLAERGVAGELRQRVDGLLGELELAQYGRGAAHDAERLVDRARACLAELERAL